MPPDRSRIFADKPRDPRPVIKPEPPKYGAILVGLVSLAIGISQWDPLGPDWLSRFEAWATGSERPAQPIRVRRVDPPAPGEAVTASNPATWIVSEDYPAAALRANMQGVAAFALDIDAEGRVRDCTVTSSSGWDLLDSATCATMMRRARFKPARDATGAAVASTYRSRVHWTIPAD